MEPRIQYAQTADGVSIAFYEMGEGPPVVLTLSPVWSHLRAQWFPEYHRSGRGLGRYHRVIRYDPRGTGLSDRNPLDFSLDARLQDVEAVVDHLGLARFALFGVHQGGLAAIAYAAHHPERVTRLIVFNSSARGNDWLSQPGSRGLHSMLQQMPDEDRETYTLVEASVHLDFADSDLARRLAALFREAMTLKALRLCWDSLSDIDVTALLSQVAVPTLVLHRLLHRGPLIDWSRELASGIPGARLVTARGERARGFGDRESRAIDEFLGEGDEAAVGNEKLPEGTAIILFTDIAGSTALTERLGDTAFRAKARDLDERLRSVIREAGGTPVEGKVLGDGVMAVFTSARQAIDGALRCNAATEGTGLQLHLGIHAGDVIREGNTVYGGAVNIAARIAGTSAPGEILVSDIVRGLARTSADVAFDDRGERTLKGVGEPVRLYEVKWREESGG